MTEYNKELSGNLYRPIINVDAYDATLTRSIEIL